MEQFVDDYFSVEKFKKAYGRRIKQLADRSFWPELKLLQMWVHHSVRERLVIKGKIG
jgi:hypothetical protein